MKIDHKKAKLIKERTEHRYSLDSENQKGSVRADLNYIDGMKIHPGRHEVTMGETVVDLTPSEFRILHYLARRPGWVYSRDQIIDAIRGHGYVVTDRAIDVQVVGLRKKFGDYGKFIETVRGIGYRFRDRR